MAPTLPRRIIGYGAYGLCFDNQLGRPANNPGGPNFFQALRQRSSCINLAKVIVYYRSDAEGIGAFPNRRVTLYNANRTINPAFLSNLRALVDAAAAPGMNFLVQVAIFPYQALETPEDYQPEFAPAELIPPDSLPDSPIDRVRWFTTPGTNPRTHKQKELVAALGQTLANRPNVIWEMGHEMHIAEDDGHQLDNKALATWLSNMRDALIANTGPNINFTSSTGVHNESTVLRNCPMSLFDFHSGQWEQNDHYVTGIPQAKQRAATYNPNNPLIINDDGITDMPRNQPNVTGWATTAFQNGLHYSTKAPYPPLNDFSPQQLAALATANSNVP
jgi:hypothetical protein